MSDIAQGHLGSALKYDVSFSGLKLIASLSDDALGISDTFSIDGKLAIQAIFKALPQGVLAAEIENAILVGLGLLGGPAAPPAA